jgi:flagellar motor component MotA
VAGGLVGSVIGVFFARPILNYFHSFAPWVGAAVIAGIVGIAMIAILILPLILKRRTNDNV